jgi:hypothetical protein
MTMKMLGTMATLGAMVTACSGLADDSAHGNFGTLRGQLTLSQPPDPPQLAIVWFSQAPTGGGGIAHLAEKVQEVTGTMTGDRFEISLGTAPPSGAVNDLDWFQHDYSVPEHAEGVLIAYADGNGNGKLDPCVGTTCVDHVLGTSSADDGYLGFLQASDLAVQSAYTDSPSALLYVPTPWQPYGVDQIPAGYAISRDKRDLADGRIVDAFDPAMNIEVPMIGSPLLDQLTCTAGLYVNAFTYGDPDCPDQQTTGCTRKPQMPPADAAHSGVQCWYEGGSGAGSGDQQICTDTWAASVYGCAFEQAQWWGCPAATADDAAAHPCSCLP